MSVGGCLTRRVLDTALFLDVTSGAAPGDVDTPRPPVRPFAESAGTAPGKLRIACSTKPVIPVPVDDQVRRAVGETADLLRSLGHDVREQDPNWGRSATAPSRATCAAYTRMRWQCPGQSGSSAGRGAWRGSAR